MFSFSQFSWNSLSLNKHLPKPPLRDFIPNQKKNVEDATKFNLNPSAKYVFYFTDFHEIHKYSSGITRRYRIKFHQNPSRNMKITDTKSYTFLSKVRLSSSQFKPNSSSLAFIKNSYTKFHENSTHVYSLISGHRSVGRRIWSPHKAFFFF
jgi:hypothetical protein